MSMIARPTGVLTVQPVLTVLIPSHVSANQDILEQCVEQVRVFIALATTFVWFYSGF